MNEVVGPGHPLRAAACVHPAQLADETLITYPVPPDRLDIYTRFLTPAGISPKRHKPIETTDIMLQMVVSGRGVAALPRWLVAAYARPFQEPGRQVGHPPGAAGGGGGG
mgnify:CR=1 FL=1